MDGLKYLVFTKHGRGEENTDTKNCRATLLRGLDDPDDLHVL